MADSSQVTQYEGVIVANLPNTFFRVKLGEANIVLCHLAGKMRINFVRLLPGDKVRVEVSSYDSTKGRIVARLK